MKLLVPPAFPGCRGGEGSSGLVSGVLLLRFGGLGYGNTRAGPIENAA